VSVLFMQAYGQLVLFDLYLARSSFAALYDRVRAYPLKKTSRNFQSAAQVCAAVDMACIWYWKQVLCLQRSAATACLLRAYGHPAHMVIGAQPMPFKAHAWVEIQGRVVNDKPYTPEMFAFLDRC